MDNDWKKRLGMVYSTNPDFQFETEGQEKAESIAPGNQQLYVSLDRKNRKGKKVTLVEGFRGPEAELKDLARELKNFCGTGGSAGEGRILIQGDFRERITGILQDKGYKVKRSGG
jgi:translation initiation factor 1